MITGEARIEPGLRVYAIGDVHGCIHQLRDIVGRIDNDLAEFPTERCQLVFLGDYVDRGTDNRATLEYLVALKKARQDCVFLMGNHDERIVTFVENPSLVWADIQKWGGAKTLTDYGIRPGWFEDGEAVSQRFAQALPADHLDFLKTLQPKFEIGDYFFCHAGVRPGIVLADQYPHDLMWIRNDFLLHEEPFEKVIVHGHTPNTAPEVRPNRINVDTRCYETGILTAVVLENNTHRFLRTVR